MEEEIGMEGYMIENALRLTVENALAAQIQDGFVEKAKELSEQPIEDEEGARQALSCGLQARKMKNAIEKSRKEIVRPHLDFQKAVMKMSKDFCRTFEAIEEDFSAKVIDWMDSQKENPFTRCEEIVVDDGSISLKSDYAFSVEALEEVPLEFLCLDLEKVKDAISKGTRSIPGLDIRAVEKVSIRVKN